MSKLKEKAPQESSSRKLLKKAPINGKLTGMRLSYFGQRIYFL
jgi:hypothetical protein